MGSESNFDVIWFSAEELIFLNWNLTPFSLPLLVEASLDRQPSNESSPFTRRGERGGGERGKKASLCSNKTL